MARRRLFRRLKVAAAGGGGSAYSDTWQQDATGLTVRGEIFVDGALPSGYGVSVGGYTTQTDVLATYASGATFHAMVSYVAASTGSKAATRIVNPGGSFTPTWPTNTDWTLNIGGTAWVAALPVFDGTNTTMNGALVRRAWVLVPFLDGGTPHATLQCKFEVTSAAAGGHVVGYQLQNIKNSASMDSFAVTSSTGRISGSAVSDLAQSSWTIYTGTMPRYVEAATGGLAVNLEGRARQSNASGIAAKIIPRIGGMSAVTYYTNSLAYTSFNGGGSGASSVGQYSYGQVLSDQGTGGGRDELSAIPDYAARYLYTGDSTYWDVMIGSGNMAGHQTQHVDRNGSDGQSLIRIDQDSNDANTMTFPSYTIGLNWPSVSGNYPRGCNIGGFGDSGAGAGVNHEHVPESCSWPYIFTGKTHLADKMRHQAAWMILYQLPAWSQPDPTGWPGYYCGRTIKGELNALERFGRGFGQPMKLVGMASVLLPDYLSSDRTYLRTVLQNNLDVVGDYMDYLDSRGWANSPYFGIGMNPVPFNNGFGGGIGGNQVAWQFTRENTVASTSHTAAGAGKTRVTVIGDDSGVGTGIDDHGMNTGDYTSMGGFSTTGATALNADHVQVTRISATQFDVGITTTADSSSQGYWQTRTCPFFAWYRTAYTVNQVGYFSRLPFFSPSASAWSAVEKLARMIIYLTQQTGFAAAPNYFFNYYIAPGRWRGDDLVMYTTFSQFALANEYNTAGGELLMDEFFYSGGGANTHHRGQNQFNTSAPQQSEYFLAACIIAEEERGITGAIAAHDAILAASGVLAVTEANCGFYWNAT